MRPDNYTDEELITEIRHSISPEPDTLIHELLTRFAEKVNAESTEDDTHESIDEDD